MPGRHRFVVYYEALGVLGAPTSTLNFHNRVVAASLSSSTLIQYLNDSGCRDLGFADWDKKRSYMSSHIDLLNVFVRIKTGLPLQGLLVTHALKTGLHEFNIKLQMDLSEAKFWIGQNDRLLGANKEELELKAKRIENMSVELSQAKSNLEKVKREKDIEYHKAQHKIETAFALYFSWGGTKF
ncbi:hypothetical protein M0R45_015418 [Rubus argutus]|uniref:Uncharacterized protein n=1 Tax=Rubus argutus TaxID=59490 RepID=A0AAW1XRL5_RUBAR